MRNYSKFITYVSCATFLCMTYQAEECLAISNPAATYCEAMGYQYIVEQDTNGDTKGTCLLPDNSRVDAWSFYRGKEGKEFSYCAKNNYQMETDIVIKDGYKAEIPVCVYTTKTTEKGAIQGGQERIPMIELMERKGDLPNSSEETIRMQPSSFFDASTKTAPKYSEKTFPATLDWRDYYDGHSYIGPVRDQGACGSCYAFGAAAAAEGSYNIMNKKYDSECIDFSEAFIMWCLGTYGPYSSHFGGCYGADYDYAELTALTNEGVTYESNFPYTTSDPGSCTHMSDPVVTFKEWGRLDPNNVNQIQGAIASYGVIDVAVNATGSFQAYTGGIFTDSQTDCPGGAYTTTNHAVALVGWGTDPEKGLYWILRNSWGPSWGENGYMRIQAHSARVACAATYLAANPTVSSAVDIYMLLDNSGSYTDDMPAFREGLPDMIDNLKGSFDDIQFGLGSFEDYPIDPFGIEDPSYDDMAYRQEFDLTSDIDYVKEQIALLPDPFAGNAGADWAESQLTALYQAATGEGQTVPGYSAATIAPGQQASFRDGAIKLFILFTDAHHHDSGEEPEYPGPDFDTTVNAILALDPPKVLSVISSVPEVSSSSIKKAAIADTGNMAQQTTSAIALKGVSKLSEYSAATEQAIADANKIAFATNSIAPAGGVDCDNDGVIDISEGDPLVCVTPDGSVGVSDAIISVVEAAVEEMSPVAYCKDVTVSTDSDSCVATSVSIDDGSFDPDGGAITLRQFPSEPYPLGDTLVTLTVTDETGLSDSCTATVTVEDNTFPVVMTQDITVQLDADGNASIVASDIDAGSTDPCGIASMSVSPSNFTCTDLGDNTVTLTVTDVNGNKNSATATVTVEDTLAPANVQANAPATIIPPDAPISFTATAEDNCSVNDIEITDYFCYKIKKDGSQQSKMDGCAVSLSGDTITITDSGGVDDNIVWTILATDQSGNTTTAEGHVLVANPGKGKNK